jgi:hypothetical protein
VKVPPTAELELLMPVVVSDVMPVMVVMGVSGQVACSNVNSRSAHIGGGPHATCICAATRYGVLD